MWKLSAFEYLPMDCNRSGHVVGFVTSHSLIEIKDKPVHNLH